MDDRAKIFELQERVEKLRHKVRQLERGTHCKHEWETDVDSMGHNEFQETVTCKKCGVPGERTLKTDEVYWPAT